MRVNGIVMKRNGWEDVSDIRLIVPSGRATVHETYSFREDENEKEVVLG